MSGAKMGPVDYIPQLKSIKASVYDEEFIVVKC